MVKLEAKLTNAMVGLEQRDRLLTEVQNLKAERDRLLEEKRCLDADLPRLLEEADNASFNEASEYYKQQVEGLVKKFFKDGELKGIQETHNSSFFCGYQVGLDYAEVPEVDHQREPPVVPHVELPRHLLPAE